MFLSNSRAIYNKNTIEGFSGPGYAQAIYNKNNIEDFSVPCYSKASYNIPPLL